MDGEEPGTFVAVGVPSPFSPKCCVGEAEEVPGLDVGAANLVGNSVGPEEGTDGDAGGDITGDGSSVGTDAEEIVGFELSVGRFVGSDVGALVGTSERLGEGITLGVPDGSFVGSGVGCFDGEPVGNLVGPVEGENVGPSDGMAVVGVMEGVSVGLEEAEGSTVGSLVGRVDAVGETVGLLVGAGLTDGNSEGREVGVEEDIISVGAVLSLPFPVTGAADDGPFCPNTVVGLVVGVSFCDSENPFVGFVLGVSRGVSVGALVAESCPKLGMLGFDVGADVGTGVGIFPVNIGFIKPIGNIISPPLKPLPFEEELDFELWSLSQYDQ